MYGLNKPRTKLGRFLDKNGLAQEKVRNHAGVSRDLMADICGNPNHHPQDKTMIKIIGALRMMGYDVRMNDFW